MIAGSGSPGISIGFRVRADGERPRRDLAVRLRPWQARIGAHLCSRTAPGVITLASRPIRCPGDPDGCSRQASSRAPLHRRAGSVAGTPDESLHGFQLGRGKGVDGANPHEEQIELIDPQATVPGIVQQVEHCESGGDRRPEIPPVASPALPQKCFTSKVGPGIARGRRWILPDLGIGRGRRGSRVSILSRGGLATVDADDDDESHEQADEEAGARPGG